MKAILLFIFVIGLSQAKVELSCLEKCEADWDNCTSTLWNTACDCLKPYDDCIRNVCNADDSFIEADCYTYNCDWCEEKFGAYYIVAIVVVLALIAIVLFVCLICYLCGVLKKRMHRTGQNVLLLDPNDPGHQAFRPYDSIRN